MTSKNIVNSSVIIFLIGVFVSITGLFIYDRYQRNNLQTPIKIYRAPTEAEEAIVRENIKAIAQRQKREAQKKKDLQQSAADDMLDQNDNRDNTNNRTETSETIPEAVASMPSEIDRPGISKSEKEQMGQYVSAKTYGSLEESQNALRDLVGIHHPPNLGEGLTIQINSQEDLKKAIAQLENSDNPAAQHMINQLKNMNFDGNTRFTVHLANP